MRLRPFRLEAWLEDHERSAPHLLAHSGVASAPGLAFPAPLAPEDWGYGEVPHDAALARAISDRYRVPVDEVLVTVGASEADFLVFLGLVEPGMRVAVECPTYFPLAEVPRVLGADVVNLRRLPDDGFAFPIGDAVAALRSGARLVVLSNPNNPTGATASPAILRELAAEAEVRDAWVLVDEIFHELADVPAASARTVHARIIASNSFTKSFGAAGLRTGWLLAPSEVMAHARNGKALTSLANGVLDQDASLAALVHADALLARANSIRRENLARLEKSLATIPNIAWTRPAAGVACAIRLPDGVDDVVYARRAVAEAGVLVVPGTYLDLPGFIRLGFGGAPRAFAAGLDAWATWHSMAYP